MSEPIGLATDEAGRRIYKPDGEELRKFLVDTSHVSVIRGPIGSGTSSASMMKIYKLATEQAAWNGVRRTRWAVVRQTYPELVNTTLATWLFWFPEELYGRLNRSRPMRHDIRIGDVEMEVWFLALDDEADIKKLRSLELTGVLFNELEYQTKQIFDEAESRTGRFPSKAEGGPSWWGVVGDMNAPTEDHWLVQMTGEAPYPDEVPEDKRLVWPKDWAYFVQPPALLEIKGADGKVQGYAENPQGENRRWLVEGYYLEKARGKSKQWIDSRLMNRITFVADGDPVWPNFDPQIHNAPGSLGYVRDRVVYVSLDFGRRPTALIAQDIGGKIQCQREFRMYGVGAAIFAPALKRFLEQNYRGARIEFTGDPKGRDRGQADERSAYDIFKGLGMTVTPAPVKNNHLETRIEAVSYALQTNRILVGQDCATLRAALAGKYYLKKMDDGADPMKDKYSDIADTLQYLCLFLGEGRRMVGLDAAQAKGRIDARPRPRSLRRVA